MMSTKAKSHLIKVALFLLLLGVLLTAMSYRMDLVYSVHATHTSVYTVQSGDTLWDIAQRVDKADYTPAVVTWIEQHNAVQDDVVHEGQKLLVP